MKFGLTDETFKKIKNVVDKFRNYDFFVFGSRARGDYKKNSDIDIVVKNCIDEKEKFNVKNEMDLLNIPYTIDLIFIEDITKKEFLESIERDEVKYE